MTAKDLMVGDWVQNIYGVKGWVFDIRYYKDGFGERYCIKLAYDDKGESYACPEMDLIEPILLTPEILEKNGLLDIAHSEYYVRYDRHDEEWYFIYYGSFAEMKVSITAVHELQHCLKLCGIDKEIVL
jgi:hypothetical protein